MTTYQTTINHKKSPTHTRSSILKAAEKIHKEKMALTLEAPQKPILRQTQQSPLVSRALLNSELLMANRRFKSTQKPKMYQNSFIQPEAVLARGAPRLPTYNVLPSVVNSLKQYQSNQSSRLSIPKLNTQGSTSQLEEYLN